MINRSIRICCLSDLHLGHSNTPTTFILDNLNSVFKDSPEFGEYDIIFLAGDFFDTLMHLPDTNVLEIHLWITNFLRLCKKHNVILRVLEGTPSHDWKQSKLFHQLNGITRIECDVAYYDYLHIEFIESLGLSILYIPDEWNTYCDDTWKDVTKLLKEHNLEKVDLIIMHGAFDYQFPKIASIDTHKSDRYLNIVNHLIFIGHVHTHSINDRIIAPGSFDRLKHNEEELKGCIEAVIKPDYSYEITFIENKNSKIYKTINCSNMTIDNTLKYLDKELEKLPQESFIRIEANKDDPILVSMDTLKKSFPGIRFSTKISKTAETDSQNLIDLRNSYHPISITSVNIVDLLIERLKSKGVNMEDLMTSKELLENYV